MRAQAFESLLQELGPYQKKPTQWHVRRIAGALVPLLSLSLHVCAKWIRSSASAMHSAVFVLLRFLAASASKCFVYLTIYLI